MLEAMGFQLTGSYAAVPANGPAANESQPHPLPGLRLLGSEQGPRKKTKPRRSRVSQVRDGP
jgi:hypothetical protein